MRRAWTPGPLFVISLLAAALLAFSACSSGGDDEEDDGGGTEPTATAEADGGGDGGDDGGDGDADLSAQLTELGTDWGNVSGKISYELTDATSGTSNFTVYQDPPNKSRMDISTDQGDVIIISTSEASYFCTSTSDTEGFCFESPADQTAVPPFFSGFAAPETFSGLSNSLAGLESYEDEIAGVNANCFRTTGSGLYLGGEGTAAWCFSDEGLLLLSEFAGAGSEFRMEATGVGDVSDSDFEPPFEVTPGG